MGQQFSFGSGFLYGIPTSDYTGAAVTTPTPQQFGVLQEGSVEVSFDTKELYGQKQFPLAVGRTKGKISGKAKYAQLNGGLINSLFFGQTLEEGVRSNHADLTGQLVPDDPYQISVTPPASGVWTEDRGVVDATGSTMTRVAANPVAGQYAVEGGVYTFAAEESGKKVFISYQYETTGSGSEVKSTIINAPMGYAPTFRCELYVPFQGKNLVLTIPGAISTKLTFASKLDDFMVPEFDFSGFADASGNVMSYALTER